MKIIIDYLYPAIVASKHGILQKNQNFYRIMELYNPETCTFFTPVRELGISLEEMHVVTGLPFGKCPYKKFIPCAEKLNELKQNNLEMYKTYL